MARQLLTDGHQVYGAGRTRPDFLPADNFLLMDVRDHDSVQAAVNDVIKMAGRIDVLINNAGIGLAGPIEEFSDEDARLEWETNLLGAHRLCRAVLPHMRCNGRGKIINISSIAGIMGIPFQGFYSSSKFALQGYSEALRMEVKPFGIDVIVINPGDFATGFTSNRRLVSNSGSKGVYAMTFERALRTIEKDETSGLNPEILARKVSGLLKKSNPPASMVIASGMQKMAVWLKKCLPARWMSALLRSHYGV